MNFKKSILAASVLASAFASAGAQEAFTPQVFSLNGKATVYGYRDNKSCLI